MADTPVYRTLTELVHAWAELCDKNEQASPEGVRVSDLVRTYFEAQNNPPKGIIGVGAISYAEEIILAKQGAAVPCWRTTDRGQTFGRDDRILRSVLIEYGKKHYSDDWGMRFEADISIAISGSNTKAVDTWIQVIKRHAGAMGAVNLSTGNPKILAYLAAAKLRQKDGELEIDDDAKVAPGDDPGAYVQAWIWVSDQEAGLLTLEED